MLTVSKPYGSVSRFLKNISYLLIGNGVALALGFFTTAYLARTLGKYGFGWFIYAQTISMYAALIIDWGWNTYGNRAVARDPSRAGQYLLNIGAFQVMSGFALVVLLMGITRIFNLWDEELNSVVFVSLLWVFPFALNIEWLYLGFQRMATVAFGRLIQQVSILCATLLLVSNSQNLILAPIARAIGGMVSATWLFIKLPKGMFIGTSIGMRKALGYFQNSKWFWLSAILVQIYHGSDILILKMFWPASEIGQYSAAFRLLNLGTAVISLVNVAMFPMLAAEHCREAGEFRKLMKLHLLISCGIASFLLIVGISSASWIMPLVYGDQYANATPMLVILVVAAAVLSVNGALSQPLLAAGYEKIIFRQIFLTAIFNVVFNLIFIPRHGGEGAAWVYFASVTIGTLLLLPAYIMRLVNIT